MGTMPFSHQPDNSTKPPARRGRPRSGGREAILAAALDLLVERGASRLTTREVATRAGVSEGSVFYHFTDRTGLLTAVIEDSLTALMEIAPSSQAHVAETLDAVATGIERFLDKTLIVLIAAQSDAELREGMANFLIRKNFGPHRGVEGIAAYLRSQQRAGLLRDDIDPEPVAMMLLGSLFLRVSMRQMVSKGYSENLPGRSQILASLMTMLAPPKD
jgi:AcrR family transcriptional regulator